MNSLSLGNVEVVARHDVGLVSHNLGNWPDGQWGVRWFPRRDQPVVFAGNGGNTALIDFNSGGYFQFPKPANLSADIGYCSGGPILSNVMDGSWVMFCHTERYPGGNNHAFWGNISLVRSTDQGHSWRYLGDIIRPYKPFALTNNRPCEITGGSVVFSPDGGNLLCYFRETLNDYSGRAAVATCPAADFFRFTAAGGVPTFEKFADDPGDPAAQLNGLPYEADWTTVIRLADHGVYFMVFCPFGDTGPYKGKGLYAATSPDGYNWTSLGTNSLAPEVGHCYYPNLVNYNGDERFAVGPVQLNYMYVPNLVQVWPGMEVHRRLITLQ